MERAFLIVCDSKSCLARYEAAWFVRENPDFLRDLRGAFPEIDPARYRGIAREPLDPLPTLVPAELVKYRRYGFEVDTEPRARMKILEMAGDRQDEVDLLPTVESAREVYALLEKPSMWEILEVRRRIFQPGPQTLGFDLGYWAGDHFSAIADLAITPRWHPAPAGERPELARKLKVLNGNLLFPSAAEAALFRKDYVSKQWAEKESAEGEIDVIQVDAVPPRGE
jgi:hypothetical protein